VVAATDAICYHEIQSGTRKVPILGRAGVDERSGQKRQGRQKRQERQKKAGEAEEGRRGRRRQERQKKAGEAGEAEEAEEERQPGRRGSRGRRGRRGRGLFGNGCIRLTLLDPGVRNILGDGLLPLEVIPCGKAFAFS
jgi:hypothetical protein